MIRRDLIIAVLATFCLTAALFMTIPTRSQTGEYDPWADYSDDGQIDIEDIANVAWRYNTYGDSSRNVNVTNWPLSQQVEVMNWPVEPVPQTIIVCQNYTVMYNATLLEQILPFTVHVEGYDFVGMFVAYNHAGTNLVRLCGFFGCLGIIGRTDSYPWLDMNPGATWNSKATYGQVRGPDMYFTINNIYQMQDGATEFTLVLYLYS